MVLAHAVERVVRLVETGGCLVELRLERVAALAVLGDDLVLLVYERLVVRQDVLAVGEFLAVGVELLEQRVALALARLQLAALPD